MVTFSYNHNFVATLSVPDIFKILSHFDVLNLKETYEFYKKEIL